MTPKPNLAGGPGKSSPNKRVDTKGPSPTPRDDINSGILGEKTPNENGIENSSLHTYVEILEQIECNFFQIW